MAIKNLRETTLMKMMKKIKEDKVAINNNSNKY
jgi:hypothetical protein